MNSFDFHQQLALSHDVTRDIEGWIASVIPGGARSISSDKSNDRDGVDFYVELKSTGGAKWSEIEPAKRAELVQQLKDREKDRQKGAETSGAKPQPAGELF